MSAGLNELGLGAQQPGSPIGVQLPDNSRKRRIVLLLADISHSMNGAVAGSGSRIEALNKQLVDWVPQIRGDARLAEVEFAVVTFGEGGVRVLSRDSGKPDHVDGAAFMPAAELVFGPFKAGGVTPMAEAIETALDLAQRRQGYLSDTYHVMTGQPRLILFSDGEPTDRHGNSTQAWRPVAGRMRSLRKGNRLQFFAFGVPGVNAALMRELDPEDGKGFYELRSLDFKMLLDMILMATLSDDDPYETMRAVFG